MHNIAIRCDGLSKQYRIGKRERYKALRDTVTDSISTPFRKVRSVFQKANAITKPVNDSHFWALDNVSFEVNQGEVIGIIGRNGAGKSTLLKILSRITEPTKGYAEIRGVVSSLLEVGTGFHPELTGRENIYLNGAILGMKKFEIERKFDEIVAFAETEKFLDTPVKYYSSGMHMRLAFAVAAHLDPEILLVDEVLAVGDALFQKKCLGKMGDVAKQGRTVLFVSHSMATINALCQSCLYIDKGKLLMFGLTEDIVSNYLTSNMSSEGKCVWKDGIANAGIGELSIFSVCILNADNQVTAHVDIRKPFSIEIQYRINESMAYCRLGFLLSTVDGLTIFESYDADVNTYDGHREIGDYKARCEIPAHLLSPGRYIISMNAGIPNIKNLAFLQNILALDVEDTGAAGSLMHSKREGIIRPKLKWESEVVTNAAAANSNNEEYRVPC